MQDRIKEKGIRIISFLVFCALAIAIFIKLTYLFRNTEYEYDRVHIMGIKEEDELDMVYIGGSAAFVYWAVPKAYEEYGIKSYDYASNTLQAETIQGEIREVLKTQDPELFIIDLRPFQYWTETITSEGGIRNVTDSMDYSINRFATVHDFLSNRIVVVNGLSYYLDIFKYHTQTDRLGSQTNWLYSSNSAKSQYKGFEAQVYTAPLDPPTDYYTDERGELAEGSEKTLIKLLEYCQKKDLNVLFVVCPYWISQDQWAMYNTMQDLIESYGVDYMNANEYYDEIGCDWENDFYNVNHVDYRGALKYTRFLAEYIQENYQITDHRAENGNEEREEMCEEFNSWIDETGF